MTDTKKDSVELVTELLTNIREARRAMDAAQREGRLNAYLDSKSELEKQASNLGWLLISTENTVPIANNYLTN